MNLNYQRVEYQKDFYWNTKEPKPKNLTILFTDDITQIIRTDKARRTGLCNRTQREVEKQNQYKRKWKVKTNMNKLSVIQVSRRKTHELKQKEVYNIKKRPEYQDSNSEDHAF